MSSGNWVCLAALVSGAPGGHDHLLDEEGFDGIEGLEIVLVGLEDLVELVLVLARDDDLLSGEPMFEGIEADGFSDFVI